MKGRGKFRYKAWKSPGNGPTFRVRLQSGGVLGVEWEEEREAELERLFHGWALHDTAAEKKIYREEG